MGPKPPLRRAAGGIEAGLQRQAQTREAEGFREDLIDAERLVDRLILLGQIRGENQDAPREPGRAQRPDEGRAADAGHIVIAEEDGKTTGLGLDQVESGLSIVGSGDGVAAKLQSRLDRKSDSRFIIHDEDLNHIFHIFHNFGGQ